MKKSMRSVLSIISTTVFASAVVLFGFQPAPILAAEQADHVGKSNVLTYVNDENEHAIPDGNEGGDEVVPGVLTLPIEITQDYTLSDLNVQVNINHPYDKDLIISLIAPTGTELTLVNRSGSDGDNFNYTTFDDSASRSISEGTAPFSGVYRPFASLYYLNGMSTKGTWTLKVTDNGQDDIGTLDYFGLYLTYVTDADNDGSNFDVDCNDNDSSVYPGAPEMCDSVDNDCDGQVDESPVDGNLYTVYSDNDSDGYGNSADFIVVKSCTELDMSNFSLASLIAGDCNDNDASINPSATEVPDDGIDNNCDGVDESDITYDDDNDGYAENEGDCNDSDASINPDAPEICDGIDNNCSLEIDENLLTTYFLDEDGDGYGDGENTQNLCSANSTYVTNGDDCDDNSVSVHPGTSDDTQDGVDNNCDGYVDEGYVAVVDADDDGYTSDVDCDDNNASVYPTSIEFSDDGIDNNCNGVVDETNLEESCSVDTDLGSVTGEAFATGTLEGATNNYAGNYGGGADVIFSYTAPYTATYELNTEGSNYDTMLYLIDGVDCIGTILEVDDDSGDTFHLSKLTYDLVSGQTVLIVLDAYHYGYNGDGSTYQLNILTSIADRDHDGFTDDIDCNDNYDNIYPGAQEYCDGRDNNCDGIIDEGFSMSFYTQYVDHDGDSWGSSDQVGICWPASEHSVPLSDKTGDCNDENTSVFPGASDNTNDGVDNNCNSQIDEDYKAPADTNTNTNTGNTNTNTNSGNTNTNGDTTTTPPADTNTDTNTNTDEVDVTTEDKTPETSDTDTQITEVTVVKVSPTKKGYKITYSDGSVKTVVVFKTKSQKKTKVKYYPKKDLVLVLQGNGKKIALWNVLTNQKVSQAKLSSKAYNTNSFKIKKIDDKKTVIIKSLNKKQQESQKSLVRLSLNKQSLKTISTILGE